MFKFLNTISSNNKYVTLLLSEYQSILKAVSISVITDINISNFIIYE